MKDIYKCGGCGEWFYSEHINRVHDSGDQLPELVCDVCIYKILWENKK